MSLPVGYTLVYRDDAMMRRRLASGRRPLDRVRAKKDGGRPWTGPWRHLEAEAERDAANHVKKQR